MRGPANAGTRVLATVCSVTTTDLTIAHISDTHIGYEAYKATSAAGENQRAVDIAKAFVTSVQEIVELDPPLVIHSGDVADRTIIPIRLMLLVRSQVAKLADIRPDGTRRQVVIVAGNHELPRNKKEACFLELLRGLPGVHVVTNGYTQIEFPDAGSSAGRDPRLADVVVHALPHDALKEVDFDDVRPVDGKLNLFSAHGVAGGSELYVRSLGREFSIPTDVLARDWEYGALGHWHKQGPVPIVRTGGKRKKDDAAPETGRIWYAGSTENMGFGDLKDNGTQRGWLEVTVAKGKDPQVRRRHVPIRSMFRLPHLDATGMTAEQVTDELIARIRAAETSGAVVGQLVEGCTRETWSLVDLPKVRAAAGDALHYELVPRHRVAATSDKDAQATGLGEIDVILRERAAEILDAHERDGGLKLAEELVAREIARSLKGDAGDAAAAAASTTDLLTPATDVAKENVA